MLGNISGPVWGRVTGEAHSVLIVGTGPSVESVDFDIIPDNVFVIAVKDAISFLPRTNAWVTVDVNNRALVHMKKRKRDVVYYAAVPDSFGTSRARSPYHRRIVPDIVYLRRMAQPTAYSNWQLSEDPQALMSGNSGFGALGIAYLMNARRITLIGIDGGWLPYGRCAGRPSRPLTHLPKLFESARSQLTAKNVEVVNASRRGQVRCFPYMPWNTAMEWMSE